MNACVCIACVNNFKFRMINNQALTTIFDLSVNDNILTDHDHFMDEDHVKPSQSNLIYPCPIRITYQSLKESAPPIELP